MATCTAAALLLVTAGCRSPQYVTLSPSQFVSRYEAVRAAAEAQGCVVECRNAGRAGDWMAFDYWDGSQLSIGTAYVCTYRTPAAWLPEGLPEGGLAAAYSRLGPEQMMPEANAALRRIAELTGQPAGVAIPQLIPYMTDDATRVRWQAAGALRQFGPDAFEPLSKALDEAGATVRPALFAAIVACRCDELAPRLTEMVMTGAVSGAQAGDAVQALMLLERASDVILIAREHESPTVRVFARALVVDSLDAAPRYPGAH